MSTEGQIVTSVNAQPCHFVVTKSPKGVYSWEVSIYASNLAEGERMTAEATDWLEQKYGKGVTEG